MDEAAVLKAIADKGIRLGLDVYPDEPTAGKGPFVSKLAQHPNVYGTHHIGASTEQAQRAIAAEVVAMLDDYARGEVRNCVNIVSQPLGTATVVVRHLDEVGVLSEVLAALRTHDLNVEQMHNTIFAGRRAAVATIHLSGTPPRDLEHSLNAISRVINARVRHAEARD
jgi:D-3-phosphoglycerate dehydrogenase